MFPYLKICLINFMGNWMSFNNSADKSQPKMLLLAQQLFCTRAAYSSLIKPSSSRKTSDDFSIQHNEVVLFNDIVQLVKGSTQSNFIERLPLLFKKINSDLTLRKAYLTLLQQLRFAESGMQAAASSGDSLPSRVSENFSLKFKRDVNQPSQVYVILTIDNPAEHHLNHAIALHITKDDIVDSLYFPLVTDGRSQLLMEDTDKHFTLITDNNSHLYLI